ncbi:MAG: nucleotidyl transferase AbiEii/AbiGii toxin family protein [Candidatus Rokuibacteriota bacterium]
MTEELEVLTTVGRRLDALGVPYMITGSMAVNYYAVPRMTRDIDIVVELSGREAERLCQAFQDDFYVDRDAVRRAIDERGLFNLIHVASVVKVDFVVRKDSDYRRQEFARRRRIRVEDEELTLVTPEDLIISKLDWARHSHSELQLADVRNVLASVPNLDEAYLAHWTGRLGLEALYHEVRR